MAWIGKYLDEVRPTMIVGHNSEDVLFLNHLGQQIPPDALTLLVRRYVDESDIGKKGSCHLFRHPMATLMHDNGADIRFIQAMLGHSKLTTTEIYTQVSIKKLKEIPTATHPARMKDVEPKKRKRNPKMAKPIWPAASRSERRHDWHAIGASPKTAPTPATGRRALNNPLGPRSRQFTSEWIL